MTTNEPTAILDVQGVALQLIVEILYRMYEESVNNHGRHSHHAA